MRPLFKVPLTYGLIAGGLGAILIIGLYYFGKHPFLIPVFLDFRIFLFGVFIFFTLKELREHHRGGILYFWEGLIASFVFLATFGMVASVVLGIFGSIEHNFIRSYIDLTTQQLKNMPPEVIERIGKNVYQTNLELLPSTNIFDLVSLYFWQSFVIGIFISIIISVILRRLPKP